MKKFLLHVLLFITLSNHLFAQPANDDCFDAFDLGIAPVENCFDSFFTNVDATETVIFSSNAENIPECWDTVNEDVWYQFVVPDDGSYLDFSVTVTGATDGMGSTPINSPQIAIYRGECLEDELAELACEQAFAGEETVSLDLEDLTPGITYFIRVDDFSAGGTSNWGSFNVCVDTLIDELPPEDLPWDLDPICGSIVTTGIAVATCGITETMPDEMRFSMGMIDMNGALPASGRIDVSAQQDMYHHPSWHVDTIGNVYGITIDDCGNTYVGTSSNYSSDFFINGSIIKYGVLAGDPSSLESAGAIYKIHYITAQASVFTSLPQQDITFDNITCEGAQTVSRTTGPGLGNLVYNSTAKVMYVTNFEDGRIYRISDAGDILDSYDPLELDDGAAGPPGNGGIQILGELAYGMALNEDNSKLFYGTCGYNDNVSSFTDAIIYSIDLDANGGFPGVVDNSTNIDWATWDNYVDGEETTHVQVSNSEGANFNQNAAISDLEFDPDYDKILVGVRAICTGTIHSSYNHGGSTMVYSESGGLFNTYDGNIFTGYSGSIGASNEAYGGVAVFENPDGGTEYMVSSADMLMESGPHGICTVPEGVFGAQGNPADPCGIISYGNDEFDDPKGVGGDVQVFRACFCEIVCPDSINAVPINVCSGEAFDLNFSIFGGNSEMESTWFDADGNEINPDDIVIENPDCAPIEVAFSVFTICEEDSTMTYTDDVVVTIFNDDISQFVGASIVDSCSVDIFVLEDCVDYIQWTGEIPDIQPGDAGSFEVNFSYIDGPSCSDYTVELEYDCPSNCAISNVSATLLPCVEQEYSVELNFDFEDPGPSFSVTDQFGNDYGNFSYNILPIILAPLDGDNATIYTFTIQDNEEPGCNASITAGPQDCIWCILTNASVQVGECGPEGFDVTVNFDYEDTGTTFVINDQLGNQVFTGTYATIPVTFTYPNTLETTTFFIVDENDFNCITSETFSPPVCPCGITDLAIEIQECVDSTYQVELDFESFNSSGSFTVTGSDGQDYGTYAENELPVLIGDFLGDEMTSYTFIVTDVENEECSESISFGPQLCTMPDDCGSWELPNVFTPNNDGRNDQFWIIPTGDVQVTFFQIFNRWGQKVHDEPIPWNGMYENEPHASDVLMFRIIIQTNCATEEITGDVTLMR